MSVRLRSRVGLAGLLTLAWEAVRGLNGADWFWGGVGARWIVVTLALLASAWATRGRRRWLGVLALAVVVGVTACGLDLHLAQPDTRLAWVGLGGLYTALLALESALATDRQGRGSRRAWLAYGIGLLALIVAGAGIPTLLAQIESQFAEEEFFVAVQAAFLGLWTLLLLLTQILARRFDPPPDGAPARLRPLWNLLALLLLGAGLVWWGGRAYQASFFSSAAPGYPGVSGDAPFLCSELLSKDGAPDSRQVYRRLLARIEANPGKSTPEYGMLALATGEPRWAEAFHDAILAEAEADRFTQPANSVKYDQRLAALRAYYLPRLQAAFPGLFAADETARLRDWFAAINRRALTVEWVDWLYGLAFSAWPQGPYENQENGAGLLALLEASGLGDPSLKAANRDYLARNRRGWAQRFRNTDDAYLYQTEWIDNALFQSTYAGTGADPATFARNQRLSFEWLLLQTLPGGVPLTYNRPDAWPTINTLYLGALLTGDPRYLWAADLALDALEADGGYLWAQPGLERPVELTGVAPDQGSCLLFSPAGLPTQVGPLAPDKIVLRDGWRQGATYLLLNLRFTGWHRYKGTNGVVMLYHDGPIVVEESTGQPFAWLPTGRSLFRDKRIPRENLNGLLIPRSGFSQVVYALSGLNGPWAQDPPHYARVVSFVSLGELDLSRTLIEDWRGWRHQRTILFFHGGPVVVVDEAQGAGRAALAWHLAGPVERTAEGLVLQRETSPVLVRLPDAAWATTTVEANGEQTTVTYHAPQSGQLRLTTVFSWP